MASAPAITVQRSFFSFAEQLSDAKLTESRRFTRDSAGSLRARSIR
jgi:hypothetical protein